MMEIREDRLADVHAGRWDETALRRANPVVIEAVDELVSLSTARTAAGLFAHALALDTPGSRRIGVTVAARAIHDVGSLAADGLVAEIHGFAREPLAALVVDALTSDAVLPDDGRAAIEVRRAVCLIARMVVTQDEVDALRRMVDGR